MTPLCFLDTETDGVHPDRKAWEVAMIRRDDKGLHQQAFFVEIDLSTADPFGLQVGKFYERHPIGRTITQSGHPLNWLGLEPAQTGNYLTGERAAQIVARMTHGAHLVGAVPNFDAEVLGNLLRYHGFIPAWHYHLIDIEALAVGYISRKIHENEDRGYSDSMPLSLPWKSDELSRAVDVEPLSDEERHTALGDARWAMSVYNAITKGHPIGKRRMP